MFIRANEHLTVGALRPIRMDRRPPPVTFLVSALVGAATGGLCRPVAAWAPPRLLEGAYRVPS